MNAFFDQIYKVEDEILEEYLKAWQPFEVPKKTIMTYEGDVERYMYFVTEGVQKSYYLNNGKEQIIAFTYFPSFSGIPESFLTQSPSKYFLTTITASKFFRISFEDHQRLLKAYRPIETLFRKATELLLIDILNRYFEMTVLDMETRFKNFTARSPHLLHMVSQKDLASYLRMDASNFSKLMGKIKI